MAGKMTPRAELEEELMEGVAILQNFAQEDVGKVIADLNIQEELDHANDKLGNEAFGFFLKALEAHSAKDYTGMEKNIHAGLQKLHAQIELDLKDDKPRVDARLKLSEIQYKSISTAERVTSLIAKLRGKQCHRQKSTNT